ncbi:MAG: response regulator transcription factor [Bacteroidetes bacterium]|nr:response regulator transcription factor [Bacteroidota bacterium]
MKALILDDDIAHVGFISGLLKKYFPQFNSITEMTSAEEVSKNLLLETYDLLLFDVELQNNETIFDYIDTFNISGTKVIFITGHPDYAIKAIKNKAIDYILKPVNINEFKTAINAALQEITINSTEVNTKTVAESQNKNLVINELEQIKIMSLHSIEYFEAEGPYTKVYLTDNSVITSSKNLKYYEELTSKHGFFRVHNSYLANVLHIKQILKKDGLTLEMKSGNKIDVSLRKKEDLFNYLNQMQVNHL